MSGQVVLSSCLFSSPLFRHPPIHPFHPSIHPSIRSSIHPFHPSIHGTQSHTRYTTTRRRDDAMRFRNTALPCIFFFFFSVTSLALPCLVLLCARIYQVEVVLVALYGLGLSSMSVFVSSSRLFLPLVSGVAPRCIDVLGIFVGNSTGLSSTISIDRFVNSLWYRNILCSAPLVFRSCGDCVHATDQHTYQKPAYMLRKSIHATNEYTCHKRGGGRCMRMAQIQPVFSPLPLVLYPLTRARCS